MEQEKNLAQLYKNRVAQHPAKVHMRFKKDGRWMSYTYAEVDRKVTDLAYGLLSLGFKRGDRLALLSENRPEWALVDLASVYLGGVLATIYATNMPDQCEYIINNSEAKYVVVSNYNQLQKLQDKKVSLPRVEQIIIFDPVVGITDQDKRVKTLAEIMENGAANPQPEALARSIEETTFDDVVTLIYTSGTTGDPKGVMLTHGNFYSNCKASAEIMPVAREETFLSFLPLSHSLERMAGHFMPIYIGAAVAYAESIDALRQNLQEIKPTVMISVPRIYEKFHTAIMDNLQKSPKSKQKMFNWALGVGKKIAKHKQDKTSPAPLLTLQNRIADKLVFSKIRLLLGGQLQFAISGGAPLAPELFEFFFAMGVNIYEGYGLSETTPVVSANTPDFVRQGTVGKVIPGVAVKIAEDGEILVKGPNVMKGYYNMAEATAEAIVNGWFHTGDIGVIDADGFLKITDRKKDLIVTAGGKNIAPQNIENMLKMDRFIEQVNVIGDRRKYLTAIVVPNFGELQSWAAEKNIKYSDRRELVGRPEVRELIGAAIEKVNNELARYESIKKFHISDMEFSQDNDMLTPTLKVKRKVVNNYFARDIEAMYEE